MMLFVRIVQLGIAEDDGVLIPAKFPFQLFVFRLGDEFFGVSHHRGDRAGRLEAGRQRRFWFGRFRVVRLRGGLFGADWGRGFLSRDRGQSPTTRQKTKNARAPPFSKGFSEPIDK